MTAPSPSISLRALFLAFRRDPSGEALYHNEPVSLSQTVKGGKFHAVIRGKSEDHHFPHMVLLKQGVELRLVAALIPEG